MLNLKRNRSFNPSSIIQSTKNKLSNVKIDKKSVHANSRQRLNSIDLDSGASLINISSFNNSFLEPESILNDKITNSFNSIEEEEDSSNSSRGDDNNYSRECDNSAISFTNNETALIEEEGEEDNIEIIKKEIKNLLSYKMELPSSYSNRMIISHLETLNTIINNNELVNLIEVNKYKIK